MQNLYNDFGKKMRGYTDHDYISLVSHCAGVSMADFFIDFVYGTEDDTPLLEETLGYAGLELHQYSSAIECERFFGSFLNLRHLKPVLEKTMRLSL